MKSEIRAVAERGHQEETIRDLLTAAAGLRRRRRWLHLRFARRRRWIRRARVWH